MLTGLRTWSMRLRCRMAVEALVQEAKAGDVILTLGAGSVSQAGAALLEGLAANG